MTVGELRAAMEGLDDSVEVLVQAPEDGLIYEWIAVEQTKWRPEKRGELPTWPGYGNAVPDVGGEPGLLIRPWGAP